MPYKEKILKLTKQLYPTGRAFKLSNVGEKLSKALARSESRAYVDALGILNSVLPDNANFTALDATQWERRLGLITNSSVSLADRKLAIERKMNHPGTIPARQNYRYIEGQLQDAGFDVFVYENRFDDGMGGFDTQTPEDTVFLAGVAGVAVYGNIEYGESEYGETGISKIVNHIDEAKDADFDIGANYRSTFFIGGDPIGTFADVDINRKDEFRQLILKIKPAQTVGFLFINYI